MEKSSKEFIINLLNSQEVLLPVKTGIKPAFYKDPSIKACLFDIYGTLIISSSGDINTLYIRTRNLKKAFDACGITINRSYKNEHAILFLIMDLFKNIIYEFHGENKKNNIPFPEVEIREIWQQVLHTARKKEYIFIEDDFDINFLTLVFELLNNKVYPMPGMFEVVKGVKEKKLPMGIISNAQFYTPVIMNYFFSEHLNNEEFVVNFNKDLQFFSYKFKRAKPDTFLFDKLLPVLLDKYGIYPHETIFIGNDMLKDVYPAKQAGFKTVLFAGDKRSLRLRENEELIKGIKPDYVITDLNQIFEII